MRESCEEMRLPLMEIEEVTAVFMDSLLIPCGLAKAKTRPITIRIRSPVFSTVQPKVECKNTQAI